MRHASTNTNCPDRDTWWSFYAGRVIPGALPALVEHLERCPKCESVLHTLASDTVDEADGLIAGLRGVSHTPDVYERESECRRAVERAGALVPDFGKHGAAPEPIPQQLGEYQILGLLGRGGMGAVYRAVHGRLGRQVALKVVPPERVRDGSPARFQREVVAHGKLDHPNVVRATDAGEANGVAFLVMELVDGIDLDRLVRACGPLSIADACELARQTAVGLHHLAAHGLVHRDVKPSNLMLDRSGTVKVLDLGLAARTTSGLGADADPSEADTALTSDGQILGTFDYLAPEQADPVLPVDARTDVYSLGCSLYFLLTGAAPYSGSTYATLRSKILAHTAAPVPQVRGVRSDVPAAVARVLSRMMAKGPEERFPTTAAAAAALVPFCTGANLASLLRSAELEPALPVPGASPEPHVPRPHNRRARTLSVALAIFAFVLVGGAVSAGAKQWFRRPEPAPVGRSDVPTETPPQKPDSLPALEHEAPKQNTKPLLPVALLGFEERGAPKGVGANVADLLFAKLAAKPDFHLVDRTDLKKSLDEQRLSLTGAVNPADAVKVGQLVGAKLIVTGSVVQVDKRVHLIAKIIGTETTQVTGASVEGALTDDLSVLVGQLADAVEGAVSKHADRLVPKSVPVVDRIAELNKKLGTGARPVLAVQVTERDLGHPALGATARTEIARFAKETGFEQADADRADVVITGTGFSEIVGRTNDLVSVRARVEVSATDRRTGKVLAVERQTAVAVDLAEQVAGKAALQSAAAGAAERLLPRLVAPGPKK